MKQKSQQLQIIQTLVDGQQTLLFLVDKSDCFQIVTKTFIFHVSIVCLFTNLIYNRFENLKQQQVLQHQKLHCVIEKLQIVNAVEDEKVAHLGANMPVAESLLQNALDEIHS